MNFAYSPHHLRGRDLVLQRIFSILPGLVSWSVLIGMTTLALGRPLLAAALVIAFNLYWLMRLLFMTIFLVLSYLRLSLEQHTDWMARIHGLKQLPAFAAAARSQARPETLRGRLARWLHLRDLGALLREGHAFPAPDAIVHLVVIPVMKELPEIVEPGLVSLASQTFPSSRILVVLAVEERASLAVKTGMRVLQRRYRHRFLDFMIVVHPDGLPGEARVKGANVTYAAKAAAAALAEQGVAVDDVVASCFDADTVVSHQYIACLTYHFLICPDRSQASFQPIPVYHNNIWDVPAFARVLDIGSSFFQLIEATDPERLVTFSSHSMSFRALVEAGYWPVDMISDDSAIFWKALIRFDGRYQVVPLPTTVSMDITAGASWWKTIEHVYRQKRRWAWGVENFPVVMRAFVASRSIPLTAKLRHGLKLFETNISWATWGFLLTVIGWLPAMLVGREFSDSVLYYSAPRITATIFSLATVSLATTIALSLSLLPKPRKRWSPLTTLAHAIEWLCVPIISTCLSALPALDAQTRLMLGGHLEFKVSEKRRRPDRRRGASANAQGLLAELTQGLVEDNRRDA
jgi:cellulose synthase/poly-beta-1,6-N-acetylglucosamine synthase-like glycosyltransferase